MHIISAESEEEGIFESRDPKNFLSHFLRFNPLEKHPLRRNRLTRPTTLATLIFSDKFYGVAKW